MTARALLLSSAAPILAACGGARPAPPPSSPSPLVGVSMPEIRRAASDGARVDTSGLRGHVVVVKFVARYCEPCKRTLPAVQALHVRRPDVGIIAVSEDESDADVRQLVADYGLTFPVVRDASNALAGRFRVSELPVTFVADGAGVVRWVGGPEKTERDLVDAIESVPP